jgi:hypothetical protein
MTPSDSKRLNYRLPKQQAWAFLLGAALVLLTHGPLVQAQTKSNYDGKTPSGLAPGSPSGSYALSGFDNVNLYNGSLSFRLPLIQIGGRGSAGYTAFLTIERHFDVRSQTRYVNCLPSSGYPHTCQLYTEYWPNHTGWGGLKPGFTPGVLQGRQTGKRITTGCGWNPNSWDSTLTRLTFTAADGTEFELRDKLSNGAPLNSASQMCQGSGQGASRGRVFTTADGTAATFISDAEVFDAIGNTSPSSPSGNSTLYLYPSGVLLLKDGTRYQIDNGQVTWIVITHGLTASLL